MDHAAFSHIDVCVRDLEWSLAFYRDVLGIRVDFDEVQNTTTGGLPSVYSQARQTLRTVQVRYASGQTAPSLALNSHPGKEPDGAPIKLDKIRISNLSFTLPGLKGLAKTWL